MADKTESNAPPRGKFAIYRGAEAPLFEELSCMEFVGVTPEMQERIEEITAAGVDGGQHIKMLFSAPGFSLTYAWFKYGYPLPRHKHDCDCLYYIIAGNLIMGAETLGPGDGFFVPKESAYVYTPGPDGVEILEFRNVEKFNINLLVGDAYWGKAMDNVLREREAWRTQTPPSARASSVFS